MEPLSFLANLLLSVTVGTLVVALVAYAGYKVREQRRSNASPDVESEDDGTLVFLRPYAPPAAAETTRAVHALS